MKQSIAFASFVILFTVIAATGSAQTIPSHQMTFSISATRRITTSTDMTRKNDCGQAYQKDNSSISLTFAANSGKITFREYGNDIQSPSRQLGLAQDTDAAFTGGGTVMSTGTGNDGVRCDGCDPHLCVTVTTIGSSNAQATINLNGSASFDYDRKTKLGGFNLSCKFDEPHGQANSQTVNKYPDTTTTETASSTDGPAVALKLAADLFGQFSLLNYSQFEKLRIAQKMKETMQKSLDRSGNGGIANITETSSGFQLSYSNTVTFDDLDTASGWTGMNTTTISTNVQVSIGGRPIEYDAILVPVGTMPAPGGGNNTVGKYEKWVPEGPPFKDGKPVGEEGNSVTFQVQLVEKGHQDAPLTNVPFKVAYKLTSSSEPGIALNYPPGGGGSTDPDLRFNPELVDDKRVATLTKDQLISTDSQGQYLAAVITSYDYGSYGTLSAKVTLENGGMTYDAHLKDSTSPTVSLPKDDNGNHIADQWEIDSGIFSTVVPYEASWDKVEQPHNHINGDGTSVFEKYRGIMAKGKHFRISPHWKNIVVANPGGFDMSEGAAIFSKASEINVIEVILGTELDPDKKIVNINSSTAHNGDQCGVKLSLEGLGAGNDVDGYILGQEVAKGSAPTGNLSSHIPGANKQRVAASPVDCDRLIINSDLMKNKKVNGTMGATFAHELAHCMNVHHHGDAPTDNLRNFISGNPPRLDDGSGKTLTIVDETGKALQLSNFKQDDINSAVVARQGSQASGDVNCLMTYNSDYQFVLNGSFIVFCTSHLPDGTTFCTSSAGTGRNSGSPGAFGPATTDGCMQQFQVKDY